MQLAIDYPQGGDNSAPSSRLSELIFPAASSSMDLLLSVVAQLSGSTEPRWLTWIGRFPRRADKRIAARHLRRLNSEDQERNLDWTIKALSNGTSHTVMTLIRQPLDENAMHRLEQAAACGGSQCILIRVKA